MTLDATYTVSLADISVDYGGFGVTNFNGTPFPSNHQFQFPAAPPDITQDLHMVGIRPLRDGSSPWRHGCRVC